MPIGYLVTTSLVACGVLGALAPPRRPFILGGLSFVAGFALSELPAAASPKRFALVALLCFHAARLETRLEGGELVPPGEQDRSRWDRELID